MQRSDSLERTFMLGGIGGRKRRGWQRMRWLDGITDLMDVSLNELGDFFIFTFYFYFILLCNTVLVLPYIDLNPPRVYMRSQTWTFLPPPSPWHPSGSSPCTSPKLGDFWWTGRPGVLRFMGSQRDRHNWATEVNWTESSYWDFSFTPEYQDALGIFSSGIQLSPVESYLAVSCSFGVLIEEDEGMSYSTILELCYVMHGESCMDVRVGP